jgi:hypothetical protein
MTTPTGHPAAGDASERLAQAREHRRRWIRDAALLGSIPAEAVPQTAALGGLPDWVEASPDSRSALAVLSGALLCGRRLRRTIDGRVLSAVAAVLGERTLDAVLALPGRSGAADALAWDEDPVAQLQALGGEVLVRSLGAPDAVRTALSQLFPRCRLERELEPSALRRIADDALMLWDPVEPSPVRWEA